jgi:MoaA/NifB/PqqE/SkfB family radical SAM enzyme
VTGTGDQPSLEQHVTTRRRFLNGFAKLVVYVRVAVHVAVRYALRPRAFGFSPLAYASFLWRAFRLLLVFRHHKVVRVPNGYKLHVYLPAYPSRAFFHAVEAKLLWRDPGPTTVVFSMTKACSLKCSHCYQKRDGGADLDEGTLVETARAVQDAGVAMFDIEGGEPFLRFERLLTLVRALDGRSEIWVNTAGDRVGPEGLAELKKAGVFGFFVSIHSPDPARHDALTGVDGSFATAVRAVRMMRDAGFVIAFNTCLAEEELRRGRLADLMDLARQVDVDFVQLIHPKPAGGWLGRREQMQLDRRLIGSVRAAHLLYNSPARRSHPSLAAQVFEESVRELGCTAGAIDRFYVNAAGEVQPCEFLNVSFGNVTEEPFAAVLGRMRSCFRRPCRDWLCCTQAGAVSELFARHRLERAPLPWQVTRRLVDRWDRGGETPFYRSLGIYR